MSKGKKSEIIGAISTPKSLSQDPMGRKSLNKINRPRRHPEIELAIIERLEGFSGQSRINLLLLGLPYDTVPCLIALDRLEAVGAIKRQAGKVELVPCP
jgi:hypothetical protein